MSGGLTAPTKLDASRWDAARSRLIGGDQGRRKKDDFYPTPRHATEQLLEVEDFDGAIWEPACGDGAISSVLAEGGPPVVSSDLVDRGYGETGVDFLIEWEPRAPNIITNPPFKLAVPFVRHALGLTTGKVAMFLKLAFLEGAERRELFLTTPLARVWVFSRRVSFPLGKGAAGEKRGSGMLAFAWFVWEHGHAGPPTLGWLP